MINYEQYTIFKILITYQIVTIINMIITFYLNYNIYHKFISMRLRIKYLTRVTTI